MLKKIMMRSIGIIVGCFAGAGIGFSMIVGAIRLSGGKADFSVIPLWLAYAMLYGGLITFIIAMLWLIIILIIAIYKLIKKGVVPSTT